MRWPLAVALLLAAVTAADGWRYVEFTRAPNWVARGEAIWLEVRVEPSEVNQFLTVEAIESDVVVRSSGEQMDGDTRRSRWTIKWYALPPGVYELIATVQTSERKTYRDRRRMQVMGDADDSGSLWTP